MARIPDTINGVVIECAPTVNRDITSEMLAAMNAAIGKEAVQGHAIERLWISSARDSHSCPSRHVTGNGVDISRINGKHISVHYDSDRAVKAIVDGLQMRFEDAPARRENFGPTIQKKLGQDHPVPGHKDHFHWSVDGDHSACALRLWLPKWICEFFSPRSTRPPEVCDPASGD